MTSSSKGASDYRELTIRIPDSGDPRFRAEAQRQASLIANSDQDAEDQALIEAITIIHVE